LPIPDLSTTAGKTTICILEIITGPFEGVIVGKTQRAGNTEITKIDMQFTVKA
jgi:hypothetical protein